MTTRPQVIAHRGVHATGATENTMEAFQLALDAGAEMIELDVRRTGDGQLAILHDHDHSGVALDSCPLEEFEARTGFRPPLLVDVLDWAAGRIALDVELKEDGYAEQLAPLLDGFVAAGGELLVTSFLDPLLAHLGRLAPSLRLGLLVEWTANRAAERAQARGCARRAALDEAGRRAADRRGGRGGPRTDRLGLHGGRPCRAARRRARCRRHHRRRARTRWRPAPR